MPTRASSHSSPLPPPVVLMSQDKMEPRCLLLGKKYVHHSQMFGQHKMGDRFEGVPTSRFPRYTGTQTPSPTQTCGGGIWGGGWSTTGTPGTPQQPTAMDTSGSDHNPGSACGLPVFSHLVTCLPARPIPTSGRFLFLPLLTSHPG